MASFMGGVQGNRGEATRLGSKDSGCDSWVKSWQTRASIEIRESEKGQDIIGISIKKIGDNNLKFLDIDFKAFEKSLTDIRINGIDFKEILEAYNLIKFPEKIENGK